MPANGNVCMQECLYQVCDGVITQIAAGEGALLDVYDLEGTENPRCPGLKVVCPLDSSVEIPVYLVDMVNSGKVAAGIYIPVHVDGRVVHWDKRAIEYRHGIDYVSSDGLVCVKFYGMLSRRYNIKDVLKTESSYSGHEESLHWCDCDTNYVDCETIMRDGRVYLKSLPRVQVLVPPDVKVAVPEGLFHHLEQVERGSMVYAIVQEDGVFGVKR